MATIRRLLSVWALLLAISFSATTVAKAEEKILSTTVNELPFITTRNLTGDSDPINTYGERRGTFSAGWCSVRSTEIAVLSPLAEAAPFRVPDELLRVTAIREADRQAVYNSIGLSDSGRSPVLYTHGFNIDFEKGCRRATVLQKNANLMDGFLWFSWPSDGVPINYTQDEADLYWSAPDLADLIADMSAEFAPEPINIAGHSLGGRGVALSLYVIANHYPDVRLDNVVLLAPDIDFQTFGRILPTIKALANRITIYTTDNDRALKLSERLHGLPRLGQSNNPVERLEGVEVIDLSGLPADSASGHLYHIYGELVGHDLDQLLNEGIDASKRQGLTQIGTNLWSLTQGQ